MVKKVRINLFTACLLASIWRSGPARQVHCLLFTVYCLLFVSCATTPDIGDIKKAEVYYKLGISYLTEKRLHDAFIEFQKAIKLNPQDKGSLNALGLINTEFEKYEEAASYYRRAIATDPNYSEAINNLGVTYIRMEQWDKAIDSFRMVLENPVYPTPEWAYSNMGYAFYRKGEYIDALNALRNALKRDPRFPQAIYIVGLVYVKLGKDNLAIEEFRKAVEIMPDYIDAHWELANAYLRVGNNTKALEHFKVVAKGDGDKRSKEASRYIELLK